MIEEEIAPVQDFLPPLGTKISLDTEYTSFKMNQLCKVCGEPAAGFHFGAFTCEGCKSFFGRTHQNRDGMAECKNGGTCVINRKTRTCCKACRLEKCLAVGMSKNGSRYGRRSNWFKIHCLISSQQEQNGNPDDDDINDDHRSDRTVSTPSSVKSTSRRAPSKLWQPPVSPTSSVSPSFEKEDKPLDIPRPPFFGPFFPGPFGPFGFPSAGLPPVMRDVSDEQMRNMEMLKLFLAYQSQGISMPGAFPMMNGFPLMNPLPVAEKKVIAAPTMVNMERTKRRISMVEEESQEQPLDLSKRARHPEHRDSGMRLRGGDSTGDQSPFSHPDSEYADDEREDDEEEVDVEAHFRRSMHRGSILDLSSRK